MPNYSYECINEQGELVKGQIIANNYSDAVDKVKNMGLSIIELKEYRQATGNKGIFPRKKVPASELIMFSNQIAAMIAAGIPVTRAIYTLGEQVTNTVFKNALLDIAANVEGGMSLTDAFSMYPKIFSNLYIAMIRTGELGGMLEEVLIRLAEQLQKEKMLKDNIKSATNYPRLVAGFSVLLFIGILVFLVPIFKGFIPDNVTLPLITKLVFGLSDSVRGRWYIWLIIIGIIVVSVFLFFRSSTGKRSWDRLRFKVPALGPIIQKSMLARFSRTLSTLLEGGIPVIQALESAAPTSGSIILEDIIKGAVLKIEEGKTIAGPLSENKLFPPMMIQMISVGEDSGSLATLLEKIAEFYEEEVSILTKSLSAIIEPVMLVIVGVIVGMMLISLYLPMFTAIMESGVGF